MVIYIDQYRRAKQALRAAGPQRLEEGRLCVNWQPLRGLSATFCYATPGEMSPSLPNDPASIDEEFLARVYALASQV